ncbi:hypothetical protein NDA17_004556 [Ustilago hordei]|nr:hypothetical protein NDA17_004556 [Ustilago hordei]
MQVSIGTHNLGVVEASVADTADYDLILGFTELWRLKPTIQWDTGQLEFKTQEQDRPPRRPPEAARAGDLTMRRPTLHGNEFVSAEHILRAALEDGPIGFMLLEEPPSSLPAFGFVPTGADKGVEMEVEVDKVVMAADIPKPYQHLQDVFDEVEADKLPHHTEHDLHLELIEGGKPPQGPLYLKGPKEMSELRRYLDENLEKGFVRGLAPETQVSLSRYSVTIKLSGVSVDDDEVDGVGDEIGDVDDNEVDGVGDKVGGINTSVQCVDLMLEVIPGPQWTTAFGSILIQTANLLWAPSDVR